MRPTSRASPSPTRSRRAARATSRGRSTSRWRSISPPIPPATSRAGDWLAAQALDSPDIQNSYLASSWTGWLTQREALIEIPPKKIKGGSIVFSQEQLGDLLIRVGVLLPLAALFFGVVVWLNRRA